MPIHERRRWDPMTAIPFDVNNAKLRDDFFRELLFGALAVLRYD